MCNVCTLFCLASFTWHNNMKTKKKQKNANKPHNLQRSIINDITQIHQDSEQLISHIRFSSPHLFNVIYTRKKW